MINTNVTCEALAKQRGGRGTSASSSYPCSEGSTCLDGDLGVYCQCYERESSWEQVRDIRVLLVAPLGTVDLQASKSKELCFVACTLPGTDYLSIYVSFLGTIARCNHQYLGHLVAVLPLCTTPARK